MIRIDAKHSILSEKIIRSAVKEAADTFNEVAYPKPWEVHLNPDQMIFLAKLKGLIFLPTDFQVKQNYPPVEFHGMKVIQPPDFPKTMLEIRDARGKSLAAIVNLATP